MRNFPDYLKGPRIELKAMEPTDENARLVFNAVSASRGHLLPWMPWAAEETTASPVDSMEFLIRAKQSRLDGEKYEYAIFTHDEYLGHTGFFNISRRDFSAETGYWLKTSALKQGYVSEALNVLENELFADGGLNRLVIKCDVRNGPSRKTAERNGYVFEGLLRQDRFDPLTGTFRDSLIFSKLKSDRETNPPPASNGHISP